MQKIWGVETSIGVDGVSDVTLVKNFIGILGSYLYSAFSGAAVCVNDLDSCTTLVMMFITASLCWSFGSVFHDADYARFEVSVRAAVLRAFPGVALPPGCIGEHRIDLQHATWLSLPASMLAKG